jgi:hypothetical protein
MDGRPAVTTDGGRLSPATVVIQHTTVRTSRFLEYGKPPPYAESVGSGTALVLRRQGPDQALVPAERERRHHLLYRVRAADDFRPGPGLGRPRLPIGACGRRLVLPCPA